MGRMCILTIELLCARMWIRSFISFRLVVHIERIHPPARSHARVFLFSMVLMHHLSDHRLFRNIDTPAIWNEHRHRLIHQTSSCTMHLHQQHLQKRSRPHHNHHHLHHRIWCYYLQDVVLCTMFTQYSLCLFVCAGFKVRLAYLFMRSTSFHSYSFQLYVH